MAQPPAAPQGQPPQPQAAAQTAPSTTQTPTAPDNKVARQATELLYVGFNQDYGCFACGTDTGFRIYNCDPYKETFKRDFTSGGIGYVEMLFRCNILALVGGGRTPRYPNNKVMIWDDHQQRCIGELSFRTEVKAVKLRRDRVVVVLERKVYVYHFNDLKVLDQIDTCPNPKGLCALCPDNNNTVLVTPDIVPGTVRIDLYDVKKVVKFRAHESTLACFALNANGTRLATASEKGTLIRIFDTSTGQKLQELRRGAETAEILSLAFNNRSDWLACSSDHGTVHVFSLVKNANGPPDAKDAKDAKEPKNPTHSLSLFKKFASYFGSEFSFVKFSIGQYQRAIVAFSAVDNSVIAVSSDGNFYKVQFPTDKPTTLPTPEPVRFFIPAPPAQPK